MDYAELFPDLPRSARCWIHAAKEPLSKEDQRALLDALADFFEGWRTHGRAVDARATVIDDRFLIVAADVPDGDMSGCGIDALVKTVEETAEARNVDWAPPLDVFYRAQDGSVKRTSRGELNALVNSGRIRPKTSTFDLGIEKLHQVREDHFEQSAENSWIGQTYGLKQAV